MQPLETTKPNCLCIYLKSMIQKQPFRGVQRDSNNTAVMEPHSVPFEFHRRYFPKFFYKRDFLQKTSVSKKKLFRQTSTIFLNLMSWKLTKVALLFFNLPQSLQVFAHLTRIRFSYLWQRPSVLNNSQFSGLSSSKQNSLFAVKP